MGSTWEDLRKACRGGNYRLYFEIVDQFKDLTIRDEHGDCLLHACCYGMDFSSTDLSEGSWDERRGTIVESLIDKGLDVNSRNNEGKTPLHVAAGKRCNSSATVLLRRGADLKSRDSDGYTPIMVACSGRFHDMTEMIVQHGGCVQDVDCSIMEKICGESSDKILEILHKNGFRFSAMKHSPTCPDSNLCKATPLHVALSYEYEVNMIGTLIKMGVEVNVRHKDGLNDLHRAAGKGNIDLLSHLLNCGANVNDLSPDSETPLFFASKHGNLTAFKLLMLNGGNLFVENGNGDNILSSAIRGGNLEIVKLLVDSGLSLKKMTVKTENGDRRYSPQSMAAFFKHEEVFEYLISKHGLRVDHVEEDGSAVIHFAAKGGSARIMQIILGFGVNVDQPDGSGFTPLSHAYQLYRHDVIKVLLTHCEADIEALGKNGKSVLEEAISFMTSMRQKYGQYSPGFMNPFMEDELGSSITILKYALKLKASERALLDRSPQSLNLLSRSTHEMFNSLKFYHKCLKEIETMKTIQLDKNTTLYDFFISPNGEKLAKLRPIGQALTDLKPFDNFKIYRSRLFFKFERATRVLALRSTAAKFFQLCSIVPKLNLVCIDILVSYLNKTSLLTLHQVLNLSPLSTELLLNEFMK